MDGRTNDLSLILNSVGVLSTVSLITAGYHRIPQDPLNAIIYIILLYKKLMIFDLVTFYLEF